MLPASLFAGGEQVSESGIRHSFLVCGKLTALIDEDSKIVWQVPGYGRDGMVLENGNVLVTIGNQASEFKKGSDEVVWSYKLDPRNKELGTCNRLANGNTLIVERGQLPRLLGGNAGWGDRGRSPAPAGYRQWPHADPHGAQTPRAETTSSRTCSGFAVKEYTPEGKVVRKIATDLEELGGRKAKNWPFTAILLPNKNILVNLTNGEQDGRVRCGGKVAWRCDNSDVDGRFKDPCGGQRLPNGNTVICSYGQGDAGKAKLFEVTADKKVVWEYFDPRSEPTRCTSSRPTGKRSRQPCDSVRP